MCEKDVRFFVPIFISQKIYFLINFDIFQYDSYYLMLIEMLVKVFD